VLARPAAHAHGIGPQVYLTLAHAVVHHVLQQFRKVLLGAAEPEARLQLRFADAPRQRVCCLIAGSRPETLKSAPGVEIR
jgi:hypothetical protein